MRLIQAPALAAVITLAGCTVSPLERSATATSELVQRARMPFPDWGTPEAAVSTEPFTLETALVTAFTRNARVREAYAHLGITHADLQQAARIANPTFAFSWMEAGAVEKRQRGIVMTFTDLLLLPSSRRLGAGEMRRVELAVAAELVVLAGEVVSAWYEQVGALQASALRNLSATVAETSAELARRYHAAGNITELELQSHENEAAEARIKALDAEAAAAAARARLASLLGLKSADEWRTVETLRAPLEGAPNVVALAAQADASRLDLAALREELAIAEDALAVTRRYGWLGEVEVGYDREKEGDETFRGPSLALALPIFDQGQPATRRAQATLDATRARQALLELEIANGVIAAAARLHTSREIVDRRHFAWQSAANMTARLQEQVSYMLTGTFELLDAKRREYDTGLAWLAAVRDFWIAHSALAIAVGAGLPGDESPPTQELGVETVIGARP